MADIHMFDVRVAELYGVNCAVILQNLWHWIRKNEANGIHFHDGNTWTYNSTKAFCKLFPYLTQRQIETALKTLREEGIIETGNYNENRYDRTLWYAVTEKGRCILEGREMESASEGNGFHMEGESISHGCEMETTPEGNGFHPDVEPIPDINTDINTNVNTDVDCQQIADLFNSICNAYPKVRSLSDRRQKAVQRLCGSFSLDDFRTVFDKAQASSFLKGGGPNGWMADFDWILKPDKFSGILEGCYDDRPRRGSQGNSKPGHRELDADEVAAIRQMMAAEV